MYPTMVPASKATLTELRVVIEPFFIEEQFNLLELSTLFLQIGLYPSSLSDISASSQPFEGLGANRFPVLKFH